jgi:GMP synthase - Glutamine amidotransferase domain
MHAPAHPTPCVLVVVNSPSSGLRRFKPWLAEAGVRTVEHLGTDGLPTSLVGHSGLIMLGGGLMPDDDRAAPWLATERTLAEEAVAQDIPVLGICLGAQILAHVTDGTVEANSGAPERGATDITPTPAGRADPLVASLGEGGPMIENHRDRITELGPECVLLASSATCTVQAFRVGRAAYGVQFHPEVSPEDLTHWDESALAEQGFDLAALVADARGKAARNATISRGIAEAFAASVTGR